MVFNVFLYIILMDILIAGVHCTHGFNRTGFLLVSYMVEEMNWGVEAAIHEFAQVR